MPEIKAEPEERRRLLAEIEGLRERVWLLEGRVADADRAAQARAEENEALRATLQGVVDGLGARKRARPV